MSGFTRTLVYGAVAAATLPGVVLGLAGVVGGGAAVGLALVFAVAGYLAVLTPEPRRRLATGCASVAVGLLAWWLCDSSMQLVVLLSVGVAVVRGGLLLERRPARAIVIEGLVAVASVLAVRFLAGPGVVAIAMALWAWFVVQSFAFLPGGGTRRTPNGHGDAFETAQRRLEELLGA